MSRSELARRQLPPFLFLLPLLLFFSHKLPLFPLPADQSHTVLYGLGYGLMITLTNIA